MNNTFFLLGAEKAATSSLLEFFSDHPDIILFPSHDAYDCKRKLKEDRSIIPNTSIKTLKGMKIAGGLFFPFLAPLLSNHYPNAKIIISLREPVRRTYSHWHMSYSSGREPLPFPSAIQHNLKGVKKHNNLQTRYKLFNQNRKHIKKKNYRWYVDMSLYTIQLNNLFRYFERNQVLIIIFENLIQKQTKTLTRILEFLGVPKSPENLTLPKKKPSYGPIGRSVVQFLSRLDVLPSIPKEFGRIIKNSLTTIEDRKKNIPPYWKRRLHEFYISKNKELKKYIDQDIEWIKGDINN